jgi:meso-butanediol dehydrogenase / (S,S)-butanediol dehydrogenase / diacetyl reductase
VLLANTVSVVTGGASGIGRATAELFAREGSRVVIADRDGALAESVASGIDQGGGTAMAVEADVSTPDGVAHIFDRASDVFNTVTILVNNAGASYGNDLRTIEHDVWDQNFAVVLKSAYLCTKAALPGMIEARKGAIVNIASVNGMMGLGEEAYSAAKAGMINLTQNTAIRYGEYNVRANCIAPGTIDTPIWNPRKEQNPGVMDELAAWYPLGRVGAAEDVANAVLFLVSDAASWITGALLPVDGGLTAGLFRMAKDLSPERKQGE